MDTTTAIQPSSSLHKRFISLICLRPPYLQDCVPRRLHLWACVTSCLSHYLPVCISVCPPAAAPQELKETLLSPRLEGVREEAPGFSACPTGLPVWLLRATMQYKAIYRARGMVYSSVCVASRPVPLAPSAAPRLRKAGPGPAAALPKPTASEDERPPLIAALSERAASHPLRKCVRRAPRAVPAPQSELHDRGEITMQSAHTTWHRARHSIFSFCSSLPLSA